MSADTIAVLLVIGVALAINPFALLYSFTSPWRQSLTGWALWQSSTGLALLVDVALLYQFLGDDYALRDMVRLTVYSWIMVGAWLKLIALLREKRRAMRGEPDRFSRLD